MLKVEYYWFSILYKVLFKDISNKKHKTNLLMDNDANNKFLINIVKWFNTLFLFKYANLKFLLRIPNYK